MAKPREMSIKTAAGWIDAIETLGALSDVVKQAIKPESREELYQFLILALKRSKEYVNPFRGDANAHGVDLYTLPKGVTKVHEFKKNSHGGFPAIHHLLVELLIDFCLPLSETERTPMVEQYFDYFIDTSRKCTLCAKRVLLQFSTESASKQCVDTRATEWLNRYRPFENFHL